MAQKVTILLTCDMCTNTVEAVSTHSVAVDNTTVELDLCEKHLAVLEKRSAPWLSAGRKVAGAGKTTVRAGKAGRKALSPSNGQSLSQSVRQWAATNGIAVPARGRLPQSVIAQYQAAH